jgi:hypothetical protein
MKRKPGHATLLWLHFGITASAVITSVGGLLPVPFGLGGALAKSADLVAKKLKQKEIDQENSMKKVQ